MQKPLCLLSPTKLFFFVVVNFLGPCVSLPKVKSSHEIKLKALEQSMKTFAIHGALRFLELK